MISKYIDIKIFLASLAFGLFAVYITVPSDKKIYVYPKGTISGILKGKYMRISKGNVWGILEGNRCRDF